MDVKLEVRGDEPECGCDTGKNELIFPSKKIKKKYSYSKEVLGALPNIPEVPVPAESDIIYFDSAATSLVPGRALDVILDNYEAVGRFARRPI